MKTPLFTELPKPLGTLLRLILVTFVLTTGTLPVAASEEMVVIHPIGRTADDNRYDYMKKLLVLLLDTTRNQFGSYRLQGYVPMTQDRIIRELQLGHLDVAQLPISLKANRLLMPIKVPIRKGLLGWRILLIHRDNSKKFEAVHSLTDLRQLRAGFGAQWGDLPVLKHNASVVVTENEYDYLFRMLQGKRYDYLHRALHEPWNEVATHKECCPDLMVEDTLVIHYPIGDYLYVAKDNPLHDRLTEGFRRAREDGSFDALFYREYGAVIEKANVKARRLIRFENPYLPKDSPLQDATLWLEL